jgi:hypothetical protein
LKGKGLVVIFANSGTMRRYMVSYPWQLLKKELVRRVKESGREFLRRLKNKH